jgi:hypothetical protein
MAAGPLDGGVAARWRRDRSMAAWPLDGGVAARWRRDSLMAAWPLDGGGAAAGPLDGGVPVKEKVETARPLGYCLLSCPSTVAVGRPGKVTVTVASCLEGYLTRPQVAGLPSSRQEG